MQYNGQTIPGYRNIFFLFKRKSWMAKIGAGGDLKCAREGLLKCNLVLVCRTFAAC